MGWLARVAAQTRLWASKPVGWPQQEFTMVLRVSGGSYAGAAVLGFLHVLLRKVRGKVVRIREGSPIDCEQAVTEFLRCGYRTGQ